MNKLGLKGRKAGVGFAVASQAVEFGRLTLAQAGASTLVSTGGTITSITLGTRTVGSDHFEISGATIRPKAATVPSDVQYVWTGCTASDGVTTSAVFTLTIDTTANAYSAATMAEAKAAAADIGTAGSGARTIYCRSGSYSADSLFLKNRAYTNRVTVTKHTGVTPIFEGIEVWNALLITLDGLTLYSTSDAANLITVKGPSTSTIIQNCTMYGPTIDPNGNYSAVEPVAPIAGVGMEESGGYPSALSILNNTVHDCMNGLNVSSDGALRVEGNLVYNCYEDGIKISWRELCTSVTMIDNVVYGVIGAGTDVGEPHCDHCQFVGVAATADWAGIEIGRNIFVKTNSRSDAQGLFMRGPAGGAVFYDAPYIHGNLIVNTGFSSYGIFVRNAKAARLFGNTCVKQGSISGTGGGIVVGDESTSGTHVFKNNAADSFSIAGSPTDVNNHTLGSGGATIAYSTAFVGPTFSPTTPNEAWAFFAMKASGPLDADTSGNASVGDAGASGSGYVTRATTSPGNNGVTNTAYE